ncbi:ubiquitin-specific protease ubp1 [Coemansia sp. RSA 2523]|nr:ubiquitin-specific protease ubp1 [Coemansia sp. RSA 1824]KAJ1806600.1 ubiquitin-specific protease ubp1 [Coemansia sp. RSA 2523]KAJ2258237.1 ubiquitin-specific protease ubp1 [Coemansia sp. RSA 454]KAJ2551216.1 ubiquitin-specific protease ubp1 [Coemansia sp. RSA 1878]
MSTLSFPGNPRSLFVVASVGVASLMALALLSLGAGSSNSADKQRTGKRKPSRRRKPKVYLRGLYNLGNTCFMNSTLQSLASLDAFNAYVERCIALLPDSDRNSVDAAIAVQLKHVLDLLSPQLSRVSAYSPRSLINSLSHKGRWIASRNEQDAQELFQMLSSTLQSVVRNAETSLFDSGFLTQHLPIENGIVSTSQQSDGDDVAKNDSPSSSPLAASQSSFASARAVLENPLLGMAASRTACVRCGYIEAIRHSTFDNLSLTVPRAHTTSIEECLAMYTVIDRLDDFKCRHCSIVATLARVKQDITTCDSDLAAQDRTSKRAKRVAATAATLREQQRVLDDALANNPEADLPGIQLASPPPSVSTRQTMIARPPKILVLHLSRSIYLPTGGTAKNPACVQLQRFLDISPFTTTGHISTNASTPISGPAVPVNKYSAESLAEIRRRNCLYRLSAMVFHSGAHDSGHFYAYRSVKAANSDDAQTGSNNILTDSDQWFMVSDIRTVEVSLESVLDAGNGYLLFYERV